MVLLDILELPTRYTEEDRILDTQIDTFRTTELDEEFTPFGRTIPLKPFRNGSYWKYKAIDTDGHQVRERIFLTRDRLDLDRDWWDSGMTGFPVQCKIFRREDPVFGFSYRYVNGIQAVLQAMLDERNYCLTAFRNVRESYEKLSRSLYSIIVPGIDADMLVPTFVMNDRLHLPAYDPWLAGPARIRQLFESYVIRRSAWTGRDASMLVALPFNASDMSVQTNFIDKDFGTYRMIEAVNHLAIPDITITVDREKEHPSVVFGSRYSGIHDYEMYSWTKYARQSLLAAAAVFAESRFGSAGWRTLTIEKYWTEEIAVTLRASIEESSRDIDIPMFYLDIPIFLLGTVGLY